MAWMRWRSAAWPTKVQWRNAAIVGALMLALGMGSLACAETSVASGLVVAFLAATPLVIAAMNLFWGVRPKRTEVVGILIGLVGVAMLTQGTGFRASSAGLLAMVVACSSWSLGSVLSQRALPLAPGAAGFASEMLCGGAILLIASVVRGESLSWPLQPAAVTAWIFLVIFGSLIGFSAYMALLSRTSAAVASSYTLVNPVIAMVLGIWLGHERVTAFEWVAASVILAGVLMLWQRKPGGNRNRTAHYEARSHR